MTAVMTRPTESRSPAELKRSRVLAVVYLVLALVVLWAFGFGSEGSATFVVSRPGDAIRIGDIVVPSSGLAFVVAAVLAFLGARQWMAGFGSRTNLVLAIGMGLVALSFLAWAADGCSISLSRSPAITRIRCRWAARTDSMRCRSRSVR